MATPEEIDEAIDEAALAPKKVQVGNQSAEEHSLPELLEYRRQQAAKNAASRPGFGVRVQKIKPYYP